MRPIARNFVARASRNSSRDILLIDAKASPIALPTDWIAACNKVLMLEHAIYTVASPEAAASILWRDSSRAQDAATSMKITAADLLKFGIIDGVVPEPIGGAHRDPAAAIEATGKAIAGALESLHNLSREELREARATKFLAIGRKI